MRFGNSGKRLGGMILAAALYAGAAHAQAVNPAAAVAIMQADAAVKKGDCANAMAPLKVLWDDPNLPKADAKLASQTRIELIACTALTQGMDAALALSTQNIARPDADVDGYDMQVYLQLVANQVQAAAATLDTALTKFPATATGLTDLSVMGTLLQLQDRAQVQKLLNHLEDVHWQVHSLSARPLLDTYRLSALRMAVAAGDTVYADKYRADIAQDSIIYAMSQGDGTISSGDVAPEDIKPVIVREIADLKAHVGQQPTDLLGLNLLISLERANNQTELALVQLGGILDLVDKYGIENFEDPSLYDALLTAKAEMLAELGKGDDAKAAYDDGVKKLGSTDTTDLQLSHMNYLTDSGDEQAGLTLAQTIAPPQGDDQDGQMERFASQMACAFGYAGDEPNFAEVVGLLKNRPMAQVKPYLCAGDSEGAARSLIAAMADPGSHDQAIVFMQDTLPPIAFGARDKAFVDRLLALKKRPDVLAAAAANHILIRTWPIRF